ncbi:MAG TPA: hypothetical protein DCL15_11810 [Chloroflexi bacterium]|nr:hypothetical protein [Chloroflexota bacterium]HHW87590.1 PAS domain S-box protein [Chloroflexota bacterium]
MRIEFASALTWLWFSAGGVLVLMLAWNLSLRRMVQQRTDELRRELTSRQAVEAELRTKQDNLLALIENADGSIWSVDAEYRLITANSAFQRNVQDAFGRELAVGENVLECADAAPLRAAWCTYYDRALSGEHFTIEAPRQAITPHEWVEYRFSPIRDQAGHITGATVFGRSITERRRAEQELRESEERFRLAFENASDGVCLVGLDGRLLRVNARMGEIFGYDRQAMEGMSVNDFTHPDYQNVSPQFIRRAIETESVREEFEKCYVHRDGHLVWGRVSSSLIHDAQGEPLYFISYVQDITARREAEQERAAWQAQLLEAQHMENIGRLAGGVAHDFNNLLAVTLMRTEMSLPLTSEESSLRRNLLAIQAATQRSAELVRQLLGFARKQVIAPKVLNLNLVLAAMLPRLRQLAGAAIELVWRPGADLWPVKIDPSQLDQILIDLTRNARDAITGEGAITLTTQNITVSAGAQGLRARGMSVAPGDYVALTMIDNGEGIRAEVLARIFEPFFTTKEIGKGSGLGLAMIDGIIQQNHGYIAVDSQPGQGAAFHIYLPRVQAMPPENVVDASVPHPAATILLVEDDPGVLEMAQDVLTHLGYRPLVASTPTEALRLAAQTPRLDLLMTDVIMPEMSGQALAVQIAAIHPGVKQVFMSGYPADTIALHGELLPGTRFLQKPFSLRDFSTIVATVLAPADA